DGLPMAFTAGGGTVFSSAATGYEKPHPDAFRLALRVAVDADVVCMIGDSLDADILGAAALGIPGILLRWPHPAAERFCSDLSRAADAVQRIGSTAIPRR